MGFHDVPLKAMFGSSCFPCVLQGVHVMLMLFVFIYPYWYPTWFPCGMIFLTLIINTKGVSDGAGNGYPSRAHMFIPSYVDFLVINLNFSPYCFVDNCFLLLLFDFFFWFFVFVHFRSWPLHYLSFDLRLRITPLVFNVVL